MDLFFIGRDNGREFIQKTSGIFLKYMGPALLLDSARLRKQLTRDAALQLFASVFEPSSLSVEESFGPITTRLMGIGLGGFASKAISSRFHPEKRRTATARCGQPYKLLASREAFLTRFMNCTCECVAARLAEASTPVHQKPSGKIVRSRTHAFFAVFSVT